MPRIAPASEPVASPKAPVTLTPDAPAVVVASAAPAAPAPASVTNPAAKTTTTTKKTTTTTTKKVTAPAPPTTAKAPALINPGGFGTTDPTKVGQYCVILNGKYHGDLCPKPNGSPV